MPFIAGFADRVETLRFKLTLDEKQARKHRCAVTTFAPNLSRESFADGSVATVNLLYSINLAYLDGVEKNLDALLEILEDDELVLEAASEEMVHGRCIIQDLLTKLDRLIEGRRRADF